MTNGRTHKIDGDVKLVIETKGRDAVAISCDSLLPTMLAASHMLEYGNTYVYIYIYIYLCGYISIYIALIHTFDG